MGRIHSDIFFQEKYLPNNVNIRVRFIRNPDKFCLMSTTPNEQYKVHINTCKLFVRRMKISPSVFIAHGKALEMGTAKYPVRRVVCKTFTVPGNNLDFSQESLFTGQLPTRLVLGLVDNDAFNGSYAKNPFNFKHYNLSQLQVYLDGQQQNVRPLELNYAANEYVSAYLTLFAGTGKQFRDEGNCIQRNDFSKGYALYAFDLTPDLSEETHFNLLKEGNVRVDAKFSVPLPGTINVVVYAEFENIIEIDRSRNVLYDFTN